MKKPCRSWLSLSECLLLDVPLYKPTLCFEKLKFFEEIICRCSILQPQLISQATGASAACSVCESSWMFSLRESSENHSSLLLQDHIGTVGLILSNICPAESRQPTDPREIKVNCIKSPNLGIGLLCHNK